LYDTAVKKQNKVKITKDSRDIGILDFFEGLSNIVKVVAVSNSATAEMQEVHKPDNGFISAATDLITYQFLEAELRAVIAETRGDQIIASKDIESISDSTILGNPEKQLFYMKELCASAEDPGLL
jgi:phospholipase/lecithinase/hemolysin